jgi:hypothetical protein
MDAHQLDMANGCSSKSFKPENRLVAESADPTAAGKRREKARQEAKRPLAGGKRRKARH